MEQSESVSSLAKALFKFHAEVGPVKRTTKNPFFGSMYADLSTVLDVIKEPLAKNNLLLIQTPEFSDGKVSITTLLYHTESDEWIKSSFGMTPKDANNPQVLGSIITYLRRYTIPGLCMVASEDDDDGNASTEPDKKKEEKQPDKKEEKKPAPTGKISTGQTKYVQMLFSKAGYKEDLDKYAYCCGVIDRPISSISELTTKEAHAVIEALTKLLGTPEAS